MDRVTVQYGQVPLETDLLQAERFGLTGLAKLGEAVLGTITSVSGFSLTPTGPASMSCVLSAGQIYGMQNLEATAWSSLAVDTHSVLKQGLSLDPQTLTFTAPAQSGYAQYALVQATYVDQDTGAVVRPYYNAANPTQPFSGPGNAGTADNTQRKGAVSVSLKYGVAATSGQQVAPTPDAGYAGLFLVLLTFGQTTIGAAQISQYSAAPFIPVTLPAVPATAQSGAWITSADTGAANAYVAGTTTNLGTPVKGTQVELSGISATNTGASTLNFGGIAYPIVRNDGSTLQPGDLPKSFWPQFRFDGARWALLNIPFTAVRTNLTAGLVVYVRPDGNDTNNGLSNTATGAFQTIQGAINRAFALFNLAGYSLTIQLGVAGTLAVPQAYAGAVIPNVGVTGQITIQGDIANQGFYTISPVAVGDGTYSNFVAGVRTVTVQGMILDMSTVTAQGSHLRTLTGAQLNYAYVTFRYTNSSSVVSMLAQDPQSTTYRIGPVTLSGGGTLGSVISLNKGAIDGGCIAATAQTFTVSGMTFANFYVVSGAGASASLNNTTFAGSGNTGARYSVVGGSIDLAGQARTVIPGNAEGVVALGGQVQGDLGTAWTAYTPTFSAGSGTMTNAFSSGRYMRSSGSKIVHFEAVLSTANIGTASGYINIGLPFATSAFPFAFAGTDTGLTGKGLSAYASGSASAAVKFAGDGSFPAANGAQLVISGTYEAAS